MRLSYRAFTRLCLLGMAGMIALSPGIVSAHYDYTHYPPDRAPDEGRTEIVITTGCSQPLYELSTKVELRETYSTQRSPAAFTDRANVEPGEPDTATLHMALARPPYVAFSDMRDGLAFLADHADPKRKIRNTQIARRHSESDYSSQPVSRRSAYV